MRKFESSQKDESRAQSAGSSKALVPKVWIATQTRVAKGEKWVALRRSKPELCKSTVTTACLCLSVVWVLEKRVDC